MKRLFALTLADIRFQFRYGFYALYLFVSALYTVIILLLPPTWRETARLLCVFSDPAALGLFFMGVIMLFEKGEKVLSSIAVSPVHTGEYVLAKVLSIGFVTIRYFRPFVSDTSVCRIRYVPDFDNFVIVYHILLKKSR